MSLKPFNDYRKSCTLCHKPRDVLVRCQIDETAKWHFVCPGTCWRGASGGKIDGDGAQKHQWYRYGGMWKNKHEAVSAKKPKKKAMEKSKTVVASATNTSDALQKNSSTSSGLSEWDGNNHKYTKNDTISWDGVAWICRKSHHSELAKPPGKVYQLWKERRGLVVESD